MKIKSISFALLFMLFVTSCVGQPVKKLQDVNAITLVIDDFSINTRLGIDKEFDISLNDEHRSLRFAGDVKLDSFGYVVNVNIIDETFKKKHQTVTSVVVTEFDAPITVSRFNDTIRFIILNGKSNNSHKTVK